MSSLHAESPESQQVEARLKAIYEEGEFQPRRFQAEWLANSSGYTIQERDPETNKPLEVAYDVETGARSKVDAAQKAPPARLRYFSPDGKYLLEFRNEDLFVLDGKIQRTQLLERPEGRDVTYRKPQWSPDGSQILFTETDATDVRQRNILIPKDPSYPGVEQHRFARVGEKINSLRVGVVSVQGDSVTWLPLESPPEGFYLGQVEWAGNSEEVLVEKLSRFRDTREFLLITLAGEVTQIFAETNSAWAISSQEKNSGLIWLKDGEQFLVISEKDGWRHAFLYSRDGKELAVLTPGEYDIIERARVDENGGWFYFYASPENGTQQYLFRVPLDGSGRRERITPENQPGTHEYDFSPDARWAFHTFSTLDSPPVVDLVELPSHRTVRVFEENRALHAKMQTLISHPTEFFTLEIAGDVEMDAWMMKPKDFDESKQYPLLIYVYGEPHAQTVLDRWGAAQSHFHRVVTDQGYLVVSIDNRGTPSPKGAAWRRSIFGSLGPLSTEDQAAALKELGRTRAYVDLSRVAIWGWSGGGSNTLNAMFRQPDLYHVGIAIVPKPQPHLYNAWFQEIYMRSHIVNPDGYLQSAPINFAAGLKGKLLIVTGSGETNTHIQIIEGLVDRLVELDKSFDYMVYPNRNHGLSEGRGTLVHVRKLIIQYLMEHLQNGPR